MRVKEQLQKDKENEFELNLSFNQWLDYFIKESSSDELDDMQRQSYKVYPNNNTNYQPLRGA